MYPNKEERKTREESLKKSRETLELEMEKADDFKKLDMIKDKLSKIIYELMILGKLEKLENM